MWRCDCPFEKKNAVVSRFDAGTLNYIKTEKIECVYR